MLISVQSEAGGWLVGLTVDGIVTETYRRFSEPVAAIRFALDEVAETLDLPVVWPEWLKVVVA